MSDDEERFREFSKSLEDGRSAPNETTPDLTPKGFFAPEYEETTEIEIEKEPMKAGKIVGGILSIMGGGLGIFFTGIAFFIFFLVGILLILSGAVIFLLIFIFLILSITGCILALIGGISGIASKSRKGAIMALIGNILFLVTSVTGYYTIPVISETAELGPLFYSFTLYAVPCSIVGIIGGIILFIAYRTSYYVE